MALSQNGWIICLEPERKGLLAGTKVHLTQCISCEVKECPVKAQLFSAYFPQWVDLENSPLNGKIMELNRTLAGRKKRVHEFYCPKKKTASISCNARSVFCRYNLICGKFDEAETGTGFIKSIRWRRVMIYVVMYLDGTSDVVNRNDFATVDIDRVERVYPGSYEVKIVSELVPLGEEKEKLAETVESFNQKYKGGVVTANGLVNFDEWFTNGSNGDTAVIPEKVLVPQKTYKVQKIKDTVEISESNGAAKIDKIPGKVEKVEKVEKPVEKAGRAVLKNKAKEAEKQVSIFEAQQQIEAEAKKNKPKQKKEKIVKKK